MLARPVVDPDRLKIILPRFDHASIRKLSSVGIVDAYRRSDSRACEGKGDDQGYHKDNEQRPAQPEPWSGTVPA
jgi:hypothetical protein